MHSNSPSDAKRSKKRKKKPTLSKIVKLATSDPAERVGQIKAKLKELKEEMKSH